MKRFIELIFIITILFSTNICFAIDNEYMIEEMLNTPQEGEVKLDNDKNGAEPAELSDDNVADNIENEFTIFGNFDSVKKNDTKDENVLNRVIKTKITRTDIHSYLLEKELTTEYERGPIEKTHYFFGYRGSVNAMLSSGDYSTKYENSVTEFGLYGKFKNPNYDFKLKFRPIPKRGVDYIDQLIGDAYIVNRQIPHHKIIAGYSRVQSGVEGGSSTYLLPFVTRSQIGRIFGNSRSLSLKLIGDYEYADYSIAAGSSGRYITSGMPGAEFAGWINVKPFGSQDGKYGKLTLGAGVNTGHNRNDYTVGNFYIGYKHKRLWTNFEAAVADGYNGSKGISDKKASGLAFTLGWKIKPYLQVIGRIDSFDPDKHIHNNRTNEYTMGVNWFIKGQALKLMFNYVFCQNQNAPDGHRFIMATQVLL